MLHVVLTFIITQLNNSSAPWNITVPGNPMYLPNILLSNFPWFFPFITFFFTAIGAYLMAVKTNIDTRTGLLGVAFAYTVLTYIEVLGSLTNLGWFFTFEVLTMALLYVITLFVNQGEA